MVLSHWCVTWTAPPRLLESPTQWRISRKSHRPNCLFICHCAHTDLYRVLPGLVLSSPSSYSSSLSFSPCPHSVHTASSEICNAALKYVMPLWNIYCHSGIWIATLKYVLPLQNMYCHSEICYPNGMYTFANHHWEGRRPLPTHEHAGNWLVTGSPSLYRPHTTLLPSATVHPRTAKVLSMLKTLAGSG